MTYMAKRTEAGPSGSFPLELRGFTRASALNTIGQEMTAPASIEFDHVELESDLANSKHEREPQAGS